MKVPEYISKTEVQRVCQELGIQDWTKLTESSVPLEEAKIVQAEVGGEVMLISSEMFKHGLEVELEHGIRFPDANITNNHPILTGMIVLAHLKEMQDYYLRLEVSELEGDLFKAYQSGNRDKAAQKYQLLLEARVELSNHEMSSME